MSVVKEINGDFSKQDYFGFIKKPEFHKLGKNYDVISVLKSRLHGGIQEHLLGKLTAPKKEFEDISSTSHLDKIRQDYKFWEIGKEISIIKEEKQIIEIESYHFEKAKTKGLYSLLPYKIIMDALKELELKFEQKFSELTDKIDNFVEGKGKNYESCVVYFKEPKDTKKALSYLIGKNISVQPIGSGTILTNQRVVEILKERKFKFGVAENTKKLYENEPNLIKNYANKLGKKYTLS